LARRWAPEVTGDWHPASWRDFPAAQQPDYADAAAVSEATAALARSEPLVTLAAVDRLRERLAAAAAGHALLIQGGDCAETFAEPDIGGTASLFATLAAELPMPAIRLARIAGQYAKPRTTEGRVWRGEIVNARDSLEPDPARMLRAYAHARATVARLPAELFTSHEALLLPYEQGLVRRAKDGRWWSGSAHFLWLGERSRQLDGAHVAFASGLANPIGIKLGEVSADELCRLVDRIDPTRQPGRLTLIVRMGSAIGDRLPPLIRAIRQSQRELLWVSDPLHGNTLRGGPRKVREMGAILAEVEAFGAITRAEGVAAGGLHLEMTPQDVAECSGGGEGAGWTSACDPRLNPRQAAMVVRHFAAAALMQRNAA